MMYSWVLNFGIIYICMYKFNRVETLFVSHIEDTWHLHVLGHYLAEVAFFSVSLLKNLLLSPFHIWMQY